MLVLVRLGVNLVINAGDEFRKSLVLLVESRVEILGDLFGIDGKGSLHPLLDVYDRRFLVNAEG